MPACCVPLCKNQKSGYCFPKDETLCLKWCVAIKRHDSKGGLWKPTATSRVCKNHFKEDDFRKIYFDEVLRKRLKADAIPSVFTFKTEASAALSIERECQVHHQSAKAAENAQKDFPELIIVGLNDMQRGAQECVETIQDLQEDEESNNEHLEDDCKRTPETLSTSSMCDILTSNMFSIKRFAADPRAVHYYSGFEHYEQFIWFFHLLGPAAFKLSYKTILLSEEDELFLTLIKLRQARDDYDLAIMFGISERTVSRIFYTWVNFMYFQFKEVDIWPSKDVIMNTMPKTFKELYPDTRVIMDATEIPIRKPENVTLQSATFSTYKNKNTLKVLVGCSPRGLVTYVSDAYGGSTSDRQIVERSDLLTGKKLEKGDCIMADRGFMVQDLFATKDVRVNVPNMLRGKHQLEPEVVVRDRRIASKRIHVERIIGLGKTYKILQRELHPTKVQIGDRIIFVCFMLSNFRRSIVNRLA